MDFWQRALCLKTGHSVRSCSVQAVLPFGIAKPVSHP